MPRSLSGHLWGGSKGSSTRCQGVRSRRTPGRGPPRVGSPGARSRVGQSIQPPASKNPSRLGDTGPLSQEAQAGGKALRIRAI
jgi:hypothetical protein